MKRLFDLMAIILLLALAAVVFILFSFQPDQYKREILSWFNQQSEWQINYRSSEWSLATPLSLTINELQVGREGQASIKSDHVKLRLALLPLLSGQIHVTEAQFKNNQVQLKDDLLNAPSASEGTAQLPWINAIYVEQLLLYNTELSYLQQQQHYQLQRLELAIEEWHLYGEQGFTPYAWQLQVHANAQALITPDFTAKLPQLSLAWSPGTLILDHISADIFQGSIYAAAEYSQQQLRILELALNNTRFEYFSAEPATVPSEENSSPADKLDLSWLQQLTIDKLLLNQVSFASQWQQHNVRVNQLTAELNNFSSPWPLQVEKVEAELAFIADELSYQHFNLADLTANAQLSQGLLHLSALRSHLYKGELGLSLSYDWPQHALNIHQLDLVGTELPIQESWFTTEDVDAEPSLPVDFLYLEQVSLSKVKLLSYVDDFPFSAQGLSLELEDIALIQQGQWQSLEQLWQPQTRLFAEAPEIAYQGMVIKQFNCELSAEDQLGYFNLYGELPLGQLEIKAQSLLDQAGKPWQAQISGLLLDISPLARLAPKRKLALVGDLELTGELKGQLQQLTQSIDGSLHLNSQLIQFPHGDLSIALDEIADKFAPPHPLFEHGISALWLAPERLPRGLTQIVNLDLLLKFNAGIVQFDQQALHGLRYTTYVDGSIDLSQQTYQHLNLVFGQPKCWKLAYQLHGDWPQAELSLDRFSAKQRYQLNQQQFTTSPLKAGQCDYRQAIPH